jgi:hypothetical protein
MAAIEIRPAQHTPCSTLGIGLDKPVDDWPFGAAESPAKVAEALRAADYREQESEAWRGGWSTLTTVRYAT